MINKQGNVNSTGNRRAEGFSPVFSQEVFRSDFGPAHDLEMEMLEGVCIRDLSGRTLASCLGQWPVEQLHVLAQDVQLPDLKPKLRKQALVEKLSGHLVKLFSTFLPYLPLKNLDHLLAYDAQGMHELPKKQLHFQDISYLLHFGFVHMASAGENFVLLLPEELATVLAGRDRASLLAWAEFHERINAYAVSLSNLYGVVELDQVAQIWNAFEPEILTPADFEDELAMFNSIQYAYWYEDDLLISSYFETPEAVNAFLEEISRKEIPYYKPTREDLHAYYLYAYDSHSPAAGALLEFLSGYHLSEEDEIEELMADIADVCATDDNESDVLEILSSYGLDLDEQTDVARFKQLFKDLDYHSRKWLLRGHMPATLPTKDGQRQAP